MPLKLTTPTVAKREFNLVKIPKLANLTAKVEFKRENQYNQIGRISNVRLVCAPLKFAPLLGKSSFSLKELTLVKASRPLRLPTKQPDVPLIPSKERQPINLPPLPLTPNNPTSQAPTNNNHTSGNPQTSGNNLGGSSFTPPASLILGSFNRLMTPFEQQLSIIISEISHRQMNGIGIIVSARAPNISQMNGCYLAFVHQAEKEENFTLPYSTNSFLNSLVLNQELGINYRFTIRPQNLSGLFCFVR
jgi:hypothetical protein